MHIIFYILFSFVPIFFLPTTSELFEFNKMILVYILTTLITGLWLINMIREKKIIFRRTLLDLPLLIFLGSQILSTIFSIDSRTSLLGYYSRFNGGLLSTICYLLLYWAFVSNMDKKRAVRAVYFLLASSFLISLYGVLEHFGIDKNLWIQDVQNRVFSTLGQPNWLSSYLVALIPLAWALSLKHKLKNIKTWVYFSLSAVIFATLLFTKSRSGFLGFIIADLTFWILILIKHKREYLVQTIINNLLLIILILAIGTPWTPNIGSLMGKKVSEPISQNQGPALEVGGTESGVIRKIVWKGALQIWKKYPILGSGVETFAFSYYGSRPQEHNLVSEWDFLYNKAHNEYLNYLATTGTLGFLSYLSLIFFILLLFTRKIKFKNEGTDLLTLGLASGFASLLVSNFFGFSTVSTQIEFFLFPAFAITLAGSTQYVESKKNTLNKNQKIAVLAILLTTSYILLTVFRYWYADTLFAKGKAFNDQENFVMGESYLTKAIKYSPNEAVFHSELANSYAAIAISLHNLKKDSEASTFTDIAVSESSKAVSLSPASVNLLRSQAGVYLKLSLLDLKFLGLAKETLIKATQKAPTDAKLFYNLSLIYTRTGEIKKAEETLKKTIEMKQNYKDARYLHALLLSDQGKLQEAKDELNYILEKIDPNDKNSQNLLKNIQ